MHRFVAKERLMTLIPSGPDLCHIDMTWAEIFTMDRWIAEAVWPEFMEGSNLAWLSSLEVCALQVWKPR